MRYFLLTHPLILSFYYFVFCFIFISICYYCYYYYYYYYCYYYYIILYYIFFIISSLLSLLFLHLPSPKEENVAIYRVSGGVNTIFRGEKSEGRYFRKYRQNIGDISEIYRRFCEKIASGGNKSPIYRR